jgi:hypothetical protein
MRYILLFCTLIYSAHLAAQIDTIRFGSANEAPLDIAEAINASDGIYDKFVLIRWQTVQNAAQFRLFRATSATGASMTELTKGWQKSTWFCDYSAEKGKDYYYAVMESDGTTATPLSKFDKGYVKNDDNMAQDGSLSSNSNDRYAAGQVVFMMVSDVKLDSSAVARGSKVPVRVGLQNVFEVAAAKTDLRVYISKDNIWDFSDALLLTKSYSGFPAGFKGAVTEQVQLPADILPGAYTLIMVTAPDGNILHAKTGSTTIRIQQ